MYQALDQFRTNQGTQKEKKTTSLFGGQYWYRT
jgi:hypothetical protein